ncbi:MAG: 1-acyl-sn-glycerol-3-phosphate acyltransferase [Candidatus Rokubacteria bacterium]|nr:1-acyl-sn-glycerol-3-phosphate acyltransferase [Candidatus Rokubacteria bacterium]
MLYNLLKPIAVALMRLLFRLEIRGADRVPMAGPVLIVANHVSLLDPPVVGGACRRQLCFMAKAELFDIPLLGRLLRAVNARPVRREGGDARALKAALRVLEEGKALLVFPEGTRGEEGRLSEGKPGVGMLAVVSGAPVVPAYVSGSGRALPRGRLIPRPVKVRVTFGSPLSVKAEAAGGRKERYREATEEMMRAIAQLGEATG